MMKDIRYTVVCTKCGQTFEPLPDSELYRLAEQRAKKYLDALPITPEECGCNQFSMIEQFRGVD